MMGTIVLSMLLCWLGAVAVLTIRTGRAGEATEALEGRDRVGSLDGLDGRDAPTQRRRRITGAPLLASDER